MNERIKQLRKALGKTQDDFAKKIGLSRNFIAQVEIGTKIPSERTIVDICREFNVNEDWLRTGDGEMFIQLSRDEQIEEFVGTLLKDEDDSFKRRMISGLAALDETGWQVLEDFLNSIQKKKG